MVSSAVRASSTFVVVVDDGASVGGVGIFCGRVMLCGCCG